eukprot:GEMP01005990.1.p1 GENE.GEMP01005990.1~~GEMP01005990.1.p1  ORF type:complete len:819 (+),score=138.38 GEMP01005990.1:82-2538(+)
MSGFTAEPSTDAKAANRPPDEALTSATAVESPAPALPSAPVGPTGPVESAEFAAPIASAAPAVPSAAAGPSAPVNVLTVAARDVADPAQGAQGDTEWEGTDISPAPDVTQPLSKRKIKVAPFPTFLYFIPLYGWPPKNFLCTTAGWLEVLSGITVALAQLPEAIAWPLLAGLKPSIGLSASWMMAVITSIFGGRPAMISGATGSTAVLMIKLVQVHGEGYLFYAVMLSGAIQIICYLLKAGKVLRLISQSVVYGFVNGLGLIIFFSQFDSFKCSEDDLVTQANKHCYDSTASKAHSGDHNVLFNLAQGTYLPGKTIGFMFILIITTVIVTLLIPRWSDKFPAALLGIAIATAMEHAIFRQAGVKTTTVGEIAQLTRRFPIPIWFRYYEKSTDPSSILPVFTWETFKTVFPVSVKIALVGAVESLLTEQLIDEKTNTKSDPTQEFLGQGLGNFVSGATGGMGGCAMIGQSMVNIESGARTRFSSLVAGIFTLIILMGGSLAINVIPIASLVGVMFVVVYRTIEWRSIYLIFFSMLPMRARASAPFPSDKKIHRGDVVIIIAVTVVTLFVDLGYAVGAGVILSTIFFSWDSGDSLDITFKQVEIDDYDMKKEDDIDTGPRTVKIYELDGPLCFSSVPRFLEFFDDAEHDPDYVELHFHQSTMFGFSSIDAINKIGDRYESFGKQLVIRRVRHLCKKTLAKAKDLRGTGFVLHEEVTEVWDVKAELPDHHHELNCSHIPLMPLPGDHERHERRRSVFRASRVSELHKSTSASDLAMDEGDIHVKHDSKRSTCTKPAPFVEKGTVDIERGHDGVAPHDATAL